MNNLSDTQVTGSVILIIEDDSQIRRFLRATLTSNGYRLIESTTAQDGLRLVGLQHPDLIILDLGLPDMDGLEVTRRLREWTTTPIVILTARDQEKDKIAVLDAGADDYLTKPFSTGELMARMRVALRHALSSAGVAEEPVFTVGHLQVDLGSRQVHMDGVEIHLTPIEYKLLTTLVRYAGRVVTSRQLLKDVWGPTYTSESHYVRVYMGQLRRKLESDATRPQYIITEPGIGYRLKAE